MSMNHRQLFDILCQFPEGLAVFEFIDLLEDQSDRRGVSARLSQFVNEGIAEKCGFKINPATGHQCVVYAPNGRSFEDRIPESRQPARKRRGPFESEVKALRKWWDEAIARFPELGVEPHILRARSHVASIFRGAGNEVKAIMVERGDLDDSETMRAVLPLFYGRIDQ